METFTEPRPEVLEWLSPARRRRQLRDGGRWGLQGGAVDHAQEPISQGISGFPCTSSGLSSPTHVHPVLKSHTPCSQASHGLGWQSVGHHSKPMIPQRLTLETDATVGVEGEPANPYVACAST